MEELEEIDSVLEQIVTKLDNSHNYEVDPIETLKPLIKARMSLAKSQANLGYGEFQLYLSRIQNVDDLVRDYLSIQRWVEYDSIRHEVENEEDEDVVEP